MTFEHFPAAPHTMRPLVSRTPDIVSTTIESTEPDERAPGRLTSRAGGPHGSG
ncbi:hypothetical protein ACFWVU_00870 [Streptomyces sp. NPDC058686]|uniref:hypothetical protein n=1 Tax=Streptomyces sp. NPDC058686 TaxID=3346599 RepID=UPI003666BFC6